MAGVLIVTCDRGKWYALLAREKSGLGWRDFGGTGMNGESPHRLAARMLTRNSLGLIGGMEETRVVVGESRKTVKRGNYTCFVAVIKSEPALATYLRRSFRYEGVRNEKGSGGSDFDDAAWVPLNTCPQRMVRTWFRPILGEVRVWSSTQRVGS